MLSRHIIHFCLFAIKGLSENKRWMIQFRPLFYLSFGNDYFKVLSDKYLKKSTFDIAICYQYTVRKLLCDRFLLENSRLILKLYYDLCIKFLFALIYNSWFLECHITKLCVIIQRIFL